MPTRLVVLSAVAAALSGHARADVLTVAQVLPLEGSAELSARSIADTADIVRENRPPLCYRFLTNGNIPVFVHQQIGTNVPCADLYRFGMLRSHKRSGVFPMKKRVRGFNAAH